MHFFLMCEVCVAFAASGTAGMVPKPTVNGTAQAAVSGRLFT
jgi:hypothetical protein